MELVHLETLDLLFGDLEIGEKLKFQKIPCISCGRMTVLEVQRTSAGYGFLNGILYEPDGARISIQCSACYTGK